MNNDTLDTCEHCESTYSPDRQGHEHNIDCKCCYCDPDHPEHDAISASIITNFIEKYGRLCFCCQECEVNFIRGKA